MGYHGTLARGYGKTSNRCTIPHDQLKMKFGEPNQLESVAWLRLMRGLRLLPFMQMRVATRFDVEDW